ncbi:plastid-lipid-associated protein 14, chloroplastic, partial [Sarracenia purpurea var. burkii]
NWLALLPGKWRLLYCTGRHIGLTLRQPPARALIDWPHDKAGIAGKLGVDSSFRLTSGRRIYLKEEETAKTKFLPSPSNTRESIVKALSGRKWRKALALKELPSSLPIAKLISSE